MSKFCCVCGREIKDSEPYYCVGPNTYTCYEGDCWSIHRWDVLATRFVVERQHEYFVVNNQLYQIGSEKDIPCGFGGKYWSIEFFDGTYCNTNSLWFIGTIPSNKKYIFKENAKFLTH